MNLKFITMLLLNSFTAIIIFISLFSFVNGKGCNYEMILPTENGIESFAVCRWGRINVINTDSVTQDQWVVSGINFSINNQLYIFVTDRKKTNDGSPGTTSILDKIIQSYDDISFYHYAWVSIDNENILIFQTMPKDEIYFAQKKGVFDFNERYFRWGRWNEHLF
ncbi:hypothetical protein GP476_00190 (plasmid) [Aeromonas dhakensis]|uniref:hypothetical protein n=1 Tax=Aeromonas dhakensis TaxID=196024 RepID=UPI0021B2BB29|nr:hypothetical protein [Aeromonas dhakensis]UXB09968.1 hypothetical protein GP476_00190 [Aeromonas dhakensis]